MTALTGARIYVFPAHAGVSRQQIAAAQFENGFPRTRGGEPWEES